MGTEIERKWLLAGLAPVAGARQLRQGYLTAVGDAVEIRVRSDGERAWLTRKTGAGLVRGELEVEIGSDVFEALWPATAGARLEKQRTVVPLEGAGGLVAEVDTYLGPLAGLVVVEVAFADAEQAGAFVAPAWFGAEVTGDARYSNRSLASTPAAPDGPTSS